MALGRVGLAADMTTVAMTADLGAEIRGIDLSAPLSDACLVRILELFHHYCVVFLRNQSLDPRLLVRLAARFGEARRARVGDQSIPGLPQVSIVGGLNPGIDACAQARRALDWDADASTHPLATLLFAVQCPPQGGCIEFVNLCSVFSALPPEKQHFLETLRVVHDDHGLALKPSTAGQRPLYDEQTKARTYPLVQLHPVTRRKALYLGMRTCSRVQNLPPGEGQKLIGALETFATQPRFRYSHRWRRGDLVIWDNRCTLHRMPPLGSEQERILHRVQVKGEMPVAA